MQFCKMNPCNTISLVAVHLFSILSQIRTIIYSYIKNLSYTSTLDSDSPILSICVSGCDAFFYVRLIFQVRCSGSDSEAFDSLAEVSG